MESVSQGFESAPPGRRLVATATFVMAIVLVAIVAEVFIAFRVMPAKSPHLDRVVVTLAPLSVLLIGLPVFFVQRAQVARFRIEDSCLVLGRKRYPLAGLADISRDPEILRWAVRTRGNGGLGAIRGRYWSKRVGKFEAFMTDPEKAVVLRWPDRVVAVSPADQEFFILCAKSAAGLR